MALVDPYRPSQRISSKNVPATSDYEEEVIVEDELSSDFVLVPNLPTRHLWGWIWVESIQKIVRNPKFRPTISIKLKNMLSKL